MRKWKADQTLDSILFLTQVWAYMHQKTGTCTTRTIACGEGGSEWVSKEGTEVVGNDHILISEQTWEMKERVYKNSSGLDLRYCPPDDLLNVAALPVGDLTVRFHPAQPATPELGAAVGWHLRLSLHLSVSSVNICWGVCSTHKPVQ